jgi:hypothetical protein
MLWNKEAKESVNVGLGAVQWVAVTPACLQPSSQSHDSEESLSLSLY